MRIIDLLNKIANGEEVPKKVKYKTHYWKYREEEKDYIDNEGDYVFDCSNYDIPEMLNNEVEILEEEKKIPEKIKDKYCSQISKVELAQKYNEIIDYLQYLKSKGE